MAPGQGTRVYNIMVISESALERIGQERAAATTLASVHGADDLIYFRLQRLLEGIGMRARRVSPVRTDDGEAAPAVALVIVDLAAGWKKVAALPRQVETVVLTATPSATGERRALDLGAVGYLPLHLSDATLRKTLAAIMAGEAGFSRGVLGHWLRSRTPRVMPSEIPALTQRQQQILEHIARGSADKQIARDVGIATATVHKHVQGLLRRLGVPNRAAAARYARPTIAHDPAERPR